MSDICSFLFLSFDEEELLEFEEELELEELLLLELEEPSLVFPNPLVRRVTSSKLSKPELDVVGYFSRSAVALL